MKLLAAMCAYSKRSRYYPGTPGLPSATSCFPCLHSRAFQNEGHTLTSLPVFSRNRSTCCQHKVLPNFVDLTSKPLGFLQGCYSHTISFSTSTTWSIFRYSASLRSHLCLAVSIDHVVSSRVLTFHDARYHTELRFGFVLCAESWSSSEGCKSSGGEVAWHVALSGATGRHPVLVLMLI